MTADARFFFFSRASYPPLNQFSPPFSISRPRMILFNRSRLPFFLSPFLSRALDQYDVKNIWLTPFSLCTQCAHWNQVFLAGLRFSVDPRSISLFPKLVNKYSTTKKLCAFSHPCRNLISLWKLTPDLSPFYSDQSRFFVK